MAHHHPEAWEPTHASPPASPERAERRTRQVIALTAVMMVVEIIGGSVFGSMALLADGWHMASHTTALGITAFAYAYERRRAGDARYAFGTWKVRVLGGYTSAVVLAVIAAGIGWESLARLRAPIVIRFEEAIAVAIIGLAVNLFSAYLLQVPGADGHGHSHDGHSHDGPAHAGHSHDPNLRGAYLHVLADALTSVLAIAALLAGRIFGWFWLDPLIGLVGALVIARWSYGLIRETAGLLLDGTAEPETVERVRQAIEVDSEDRVADLHLWQIGPGAPAGILSVVTHGERTPDDYKQILAATADFSHLTVEVNRCKEE